MSKKIFLLVHGAWMGEWVWNDLEAELSSDKNIIYKITLSGLESENANKEASLTTHVNDVLSYISKKELSNVILVGHSYSGFVVSIVADKIPEKIASIIFIESFLPETGKSLIEMAGFDIAEETKSIVDNNGIWKQPTKEELNYQPHLTPKLIEYLATNLIGHPGKSVLDKAVISENLSNIPTFFIGGNLSNTIRSNPNFKNIKFHKLDGGHWTMLTKTEELAEIIDKIV
jgi:pimeloyl-ACP methyl ester carboxylesterase